MKFPLAIYWDPTITKSEVFPPNSAVNKSENETIEILRTGLEQEKHDYTLYTFNDAHDLFTLLYELASKFSTQEDQGSFKQHPLLVILNPVSSSQTNTKSVTISNNAIVRFVAFLDFAMPAITIITKNQHSSLSHLDLDSQSLPDTVITVENLNQETMESLLGKVTILGRRLTTAHRRPSVTASLQSFSNVPKKAEKKHMVSFKKAFLQIDYFVSMLDWFHNQESMFFKHSHGTGGNFCSGSEEFSDYKEPFDLTQPEIDWAMEAVWSWDFYAHKLSVNQLLLVSFLIFKHAFQQLPEKHPLILDDISLLRLLLVLRDSYRSTNPYHNFRHAVDVLQATFHFLLKLKCLPLKDSTMEEKGLLNPVETLTILIVAIGHDVSHPGVTNMFLVKTEAPIANVFNNNSVLESFHSAVFSEILYKYWPYVMEDFDFENNSLTPTTSNNRAASNSNNAANNYSLSGATKKSELEESAKPKGQMLCNLIVKSILATDMSLHFDYMAEVETLLTGSYSTSDDDEDGSEYTTLLCCLLIKCADISNVTRKLDISAKWGEVLGNEFGEVEELENIFGVSNAFAVAPANPNEKPKELSAQQKLAKGQLFFIRTFAKPLFVSVTQLLPALQYTVDILESNEVAWEKCLSENN